VDLPILQRTFGFFLQRIFDVGLFGMASVMLPNYPAYLGQPPDDVSCDRESTDALSMGRQVI